MHQNNYIEQQPEILHILMEIKFLLLERQLKIQIIGISIGWQRKIKNIIQKQKILEALKVNLPNKQEPIFISFDKLKFDKEKKFTLEFSNGDEITEVLFKQFKDYFIINMDYFIELSNDIKSSTQYKKIKEISDIANNILRSSIGFGFKFDYLILKNF